MAGATGGELNPPGGSNAENNEQPKFMTEDDVAKMVTGAVSAHLKGKQMQTLITGVVSSALQEALGPIKEQLAKPPAPQEPAPGEKQKDDPKVTALQKQLDDMATLLKQSQEAAETEKKKAQEQTLRAAVRNELAGKVRPEAVEDMVDLLFYRKRVGVDDAGNVTFTWRSSLAKGMPEEDHQFPLPDGIREFLKSKQAEIYLPPPNPPGGTKSGAKLANGNGTLPPVGRYDKPAVTEEEKLRRSIEITNQLHSRGVSVPGDVP